MKLQVYELGQSGDARTVLEESNIVGIGGSSKPSIVSISRVSLEESFSLQLVVVLSDGRRMYCQTRDHEADKMGYKPRYCFGVVAIRSPPLEYLNDDIPVKFKTSYYSAGTLVLSNSSSTSGDDSSLTIVSKDYSTLHSKVGYIGTLVHSNRVLNESVTSFPVDGKILSVVDVLPLPDVAMTLDYLYLKYFEKEMARMARSPCEFLVKETAKLWSRRDLSLQHMLPRRRVVVFSSTGMMELVFNRPVDILRRLLESNSSKSSLEYFFKRYGTAEGAAMCLLLAANIADNESHNYGNITDSILTNKAAQVYENLESFGTSGFDGCSGLSNRKRVVNRFSYGARYVSDVEPVFSSAYEGLCFCSTRLLGPLLADVNITRNRALDSTLGEENLVVECRMSLKSMKFLENKLRSLAGYLKSMMINKKGVYARVGDHSQNFKLSDSPTDLATMEVKVTECLRKLLSRSSEALFLLQLLSKHDLAILGQNTNRKYKEGVLCLSFEKLVSSEEGHMLATRLISALIEFTTGARDEVIEELRKGCPSYFNEKTYKFYLAMYCLKRAITSSAVAKREDLARQAFNYLNQVPISADLHIICRKFENLRFYDAVVLLPLQKAQAIPAQREDCYEIIGRALRNLEEGVVLRRDFLSPIIIEFGRSILDPSIRNKYISQLVQVAVQSPDKMFHDYLYRTMIDIGLEDELLKYASHDLDHFLQQAVSEPRNEVNGALSSTQVKYLRLLGRYYFNKREHLLAAEVLLSLAERRCISSNRMHVPSLEERFQYLDDALLQAKFVTDDAKTKCTPTGVFVDDFLRLVDEKLALARFQRKIKKEVEFMALSYESRTGISKTRQAEDIPEKRVVDLVSCAREKVNELSSELKSITQLLKDYVVPFELWEICGEMLYFFKQNKSDNNIMREVWRTIIDQSLSRGGFAEASFILKKFSAYFDVSYVTLLPFDLLCFHLEKMCSAET